MTEAEAKKSGLGADRPRAPALPPALILLVAVAAVSTGAIFARLAEAPALVVAAYRCGIATILLLPLAWLRDRAAILAMSRREWGLSLAAGSFLALHFATWISSLDYTTVASSVVFVSTHPIWVGLLTPLVTSDRVSRMAAAAILISVAGGVVISAGDLQIGGTALLGDGLAVVGAIAAAFYLLLGRALRRSLTLLSYVVVCYGSAALLLLALVLALRLPLVGYSGETYLWLLALAVVPQIIGHSSFNWALGFSSASLIAVSLLGEPIGSTILAYFILDESVQPLTLVGGTLILIGIYVAGRAEQRQKAAS